MVDWAMCQQHCGLYECGSCHEREPLLLVVKRCKSGKKCQRKDPGMV